MEKQCNKCGEVKSTADFHVRRASPDGLQPRCKPCNQAVARAWDLANPERAEASRRKWARSNPDKIRAHKRKHKYGLEDYEFKAIYVSQRGCCAICEQRLVVPCIDHNHGTGEVRGLLCTTCNTGIGHLRDSPVLLTRALEYVT